MPTPTAEHLTEAITGAIATAPHLIDDARWLHTEAYWPAGTNPDRPTRLGPRRDPGGDPDHVPGRTLDLGVGNDQARAKYTEAATLVVEAHRLAGRALVHFGGRPISDRARRPARGDELPMVVEATVRRLRRLLDLDVPTLGPDDAKRDAHAAAVALMAAHAALLSVMRDDGGTGEPAADRRCTNCGDPCPAGRGRRECEKCARYRQRTGRPRQIRRHEDARRARDRRRERGEDHAANPLPAGGYVEGVWAPAVPHPENRREAS